MRTYMSLPSGTYNITLTKDEFETLVKSSHINCNIGNTPCKMGRTVWNEDRKDFETLDKKEVYNNLQFNFCEPVADVPIGDYPVQFLTISVED